MRRFFIAASMSLIALGACGPESGSEPRLDEPGGTGGAGGSSAVLAQLQLPSCTHSASASLDCGPEECAEQTGHGLDWIRTLVSDPLGNLYALGMRGVEWSSSAYGEQRVSYFDGARWNLVPEPPGRLQGFLGPPLVVGASGPDNIWLGGYGSVARWDGTVWTIFPLEPGEAGPIIVGAIEADSPTSVWVAGFEDLLHFDGREIKHLARYEGGTENLSEASIRSLGDRVEVAELFAIATWDGTSFSRQELPGLHVRIWPKAEGWATVDRAIARLRNGTWEYHATPVYPDMLARWSDETLVSSGNQLYQWIDGSLHQLATPPLRPERAVQVLTAGADLWLNDGMSGIAWRLGTDCWESHLPTHPRPD